jgi:hypothetical protein
VDQILLLTRVTHLGDHRAEAPADPVRGPVGWASSSRMQRVTRLVALIWALILGQASVAGSLAAREVARAPKSPDLATTVDRVVCDSQTHVAQSEHGAHARSLKRHGTRSKIALWKNPDCDDETSNDTDDDDDTSNDLNDDDETDVPIIFWLQDPVRYLIAVEAGFAPSWTETLSSPFPMYRQLRC